MTEIKKPGILIIDDDIANIKILGSTLPSDYEILFALNAQEGIASAMANQPDLIILDIMMPGMDGCETCRQLKADERTRDIPLIFITVKNSEEDEVKGFELGAVDYIIKPFNPVIVQARVRTHVSLRLATRDVENKNIMLAARIEELENAKKEIKAIQSILPICSYCKKIRDDKDYWDQLDSYLQKHSGILFSHSVCPDCYEKYITPQLLHLHDKKGKSIKASRGDYDDIIGEKRKGRE
jgi:CheY-like chemotaxis protein